MSEEKAPEEREPILMCVTGRKGVGKTYTTENHIKKYVKPNSRGRAGRKVLIYDVNMEYREFKTLDLKNIAKFARQTKPEIRRVLPLNDDGSVANITEMVVILNHIVKHFRGGMLVLEDINKYLIQARTAEVIGLLATNRHRDLDIICHYQTLAALDPRMWQNTAFVRFHQQIDSIERYRNRIPNYELFKLAQCLVGYKYLREGNKHFFCHVACDDNYITGDFTRRDFKIACIEYLESNDRVVTTTAKRYGKGIEARQQAIDVICEDLFTKYYRGL
jgi:hypothetical protein